MADLDAPSASTLDATPAAPADLSLATLDAAMADAFTRASTPTDQPAAPEADSAATDAPSEAPPERPAEGETPEAPEEGGDELTEEERRYTRRDAPRLAKQLDDASKKLSATAQELDARRAADQESIQRFLSLVGTDAEFEADRRKAEDGEYDAKVETDKRRFWRENAAPIFDAARQIAVAQFADIAPLRALDGIEDEQYEAIRQAPSAALAFRVVHEAATKATEIRLNGRIKALEAQVQEFKTKSVASGTQPAAGQGTASATTLLDGLLGSDGLPTEDAIARARSGQLARPRS